MSTFFGGPQLAGIVIVQGTSDSASGAKYTCPAGRFAEVSVVYLNYVISGGSAELQVAGQALDATIDYGKYFTLGAGASITNNVGGLSTTSYYFTVKEYLIP